MTFAQFLFVALEGLYMHLEWTGSSEGTLRKGPGDEPSRWPRLRERCIPIPHYLAMVAIFFTVSTLNNAALGYQISLPLHMVFRSGSLIATAVIGRVFVKEAYLTAFPMCTHILISSLVMSIPSKILVGPVRGCLDRELRNLRGHHGVGTG